MTRGAIGRQEIAGGHGLAMPEQWTASTATVAATLAALKASMLPESPPTVDTAPPAAGEPAPATRPEATPARVARADLPPLPTRRSLREAAQRDGADRSRRGRTGLFTRLLTVRAFRTRQAQSRAAGAPGAAVGAILDAAAVHGVRTLRDRRVPGQRGRVEHLAISSSGVYVIDVKHFRNAAIELRPTERAEDRVDLLVGGRVMTAAAAATARRVAGVRSILAAEGLHDVPVTAVLCFVDGLLPLGVADLRLRDVHVLRPNSLTALVTRGGNLDDRHVLTLQEYLSQHLPESG